MTETWFSMSNNVLSVLRLQGSNLPLDESFWSNDDLKDPKKLYEATVLLNARRETSEKILVEQLEAKLEQNKVGNIGLKVFCTVLEMTRFSLPLPTISLSLIC